MTDDLEKLRAGLKALPPDPDPSVKAAALARAMESFGRAQESAKQPRPMSDRPERAGLLTGVRDMLNRLTTRPALTMTASVAAIAVALAIYPALQRGVSLPGGVIQPAPRPAPAALAAKRVAPDSIAPLPEVNTEAYSNAAANPVKVTAEEPVSTFSIDTDTASWSVLRSSLSTGDLPPASALIDTLEALAEQHYRAAGQKEWLADTFSRLIPGTTMIRSRRLPRASETAFCSPTASASFGSRASARDR